MPMKPLPMLAVLAAAVPALMVGAAPPTAKPIDDIPARYEAPTADRDYVKRTVEIPMRDGVKLHTVIVVPKGARGAPILLTRTPYDADKRAERTPSDQMRSLLSQGDELFVDAGYIRVFQDIRGKYGSQGPYEMTRPVRGPLNPTATDHTTDAWDTIEWLVHHLPESNGRVGMIGSSYEGFTVVMALLDPHPALKVAAPESPMVNGWMGDDWFHYGAYRQGDDYFVEQEGHRAGGDDLITDEADLYQAYLDAGSAGDFGKRHKLDQFGMWRRVTEHPAYDAYWQGQALEDLVVKHPSTVPTMWEQGLWDQEDMWGAIHAWSALKAAGHEDNNYLVMGPWRHSQANYDGSTLGPLKFAGDTATEWRRDTLLPFFNYYLKPGSPKPETPRALIYNTGDNRWEKHADWPLACQTGCPAPLTPLYLAAGSALSFAAPAANGSDSYVSDPAKPIPYVPRPVAGSGPQWQSWLTTDQRNVATRPDVLVYATPVLDKPVRISGATIADLYAATSGSDADWVVKLIDVYPGKTPSQPEMGGYQLPIAMDIFRGRYRESFSQPSAIPSGQVQRYRFALPTANHVFQKGHRIMVQIQSSWFPLYDRNPQTFVPNIFWAKPEDYKAATMTVSRTSGAASAVWLPIVAR
jgi:putative CocE/NonD family hydrolase